MIHLERTDAPCWYRVSIEGTRFRLSLHPEAVHHLFQTIKRPGFMTGPEWRVREQRLAPFAVPPMNGGALGYGSTLAVNPQTAPSEWGEILADIPTIGLGSDKPDWNGAYDLCASFDDVFDILRMFEPVRLGGEPQTMVLTTSTNRHQSMYGAVVGAEFSPAMVAWIGRLQSSNVEFAMAQEAVEEAMRKVLEHLWGSRSSAHSCEMLLLEGRFSLRVMGGSIGVPGIHRLVAGDGYPLEPHNTDSPAHALPLLAGLARLSDLFYRHREGAR